MLRPAHPLLAAYLKAAAEIEENDAKGAYSDAAFKRLADTGDALNAKLWATDRQPKDK